MDDTLASPYLVTPAIVTKTDVPFPEQYTAGNVDDPQFPPVLKTRPSSTSNVFVKVCAELVDYSRPVNIFDGTQEIVLLTDDSGQPVLFSIGTDKVRPLQIPH
jgi:hypothetical protein